MSQARFAVLAVCTANICRSPIIEIALRSRLDPDRFEVASAGVEGFIDRPMDAMSEMELMRLGLAADGFASQRLNGYLVRAANLVVTATVDHRRRILEEEPRAMRSSFTLLEFAALCTLIDDEALTCPELVAAAAARRQEVKGSLNIGDPYRRSPRVHRETADQIAEATQVVAERLMLCPS
ncbi:MAG: hypothetical protein WBP59_17130 [Ilumatobacteraceae bacterium]